MEQVKVRKRRSKTTRFLLVLAFSLVLGVIQGAKVRRDEDEAKAGSEVEIQEAEEEEEETGHPHKVTHSTISTQVPIHFHHSSTPRSNESISSIDNNQNNQSNQTSIWGDRCIPPAIEQFPKTIMSQSLREHGGFVFHIAVAAYTFLALAIICDEFFVPSLERMCEVLKIQPDVAGATFMAAGSSAPELATALIGVFVAKDDIGISGVIGSAVFNIMFVISLCGLMTQTVLYLNWWPMVRDCFFYMVSILALLGCIYDEQIEWYESIILMLLYGVYCYAMYMNTVLEAWAHTLPIPFPVHDPTLLQATEKSGLVTYKSAASNAAAAAQDEQFQTQQQYPPPESQQSSMDFGMDGGQGQGAGKVAPSPPISIATQLNAPTDSSLCKRFMWRISLPLIYLFYYTVPDCRLEQWRSWYVITFSMAMVWIALFSYVMVWMITVVGFTLGVPDTVMGLTFVAAGVSVPDALSSLAVMKEGFGDMAVSNAVGSNVFDILICLGLPWFLSTCIIHSGVPVKVISKGLTYSTLSLLSTVAFLLLATHYNGWRLNKQYGVLLMLWYLLFMILASLYELNVFGEFNPPECSSTF